MHVKFPCFICENPVKNVKFSHFFFEPLNFYIHPHHINICTVYTNILRFLHLKCNFNFASSSLHNKYKDSIRIKDMNSFSETAPKKNLLNWHSEAHSSSIKRDSIKTVTVFSSIDYVCRRIFAFNRFVIPWSLNKLR